VTEVLTVIAVGAAGAEIVVVIEVKTFRNRRKDLEPVLLLPNGVAGAVLGADGKGAEIFAQHGGIRLVIVVVIFTDVRRYRFDGFAFFQPRAQDVHVFLPVAGKFSAVFCAQIGQHCNPINRRFGVVCFNIVIHCTFHRLARNGEIHPGDHAVRVHRLRRNSCLAPVRGADWDRKRNAAAQKNAAGGDSDLFSAEFPTLFRLHYDVPPAFAFDLSILIVCGQKTEKNPAIFSKGSAQKKNGPFPAACRE